MRKKLVLEYIWLDGYESANLRSKIKVIDYSTELQGPIKLKSVPNWNFDGSSTLQAPGNNSECILKPCRLYTSRHSDKVRVLCEVYNPDGTPHETNRRARLRECLAVDEKGAEFWWGFEQEYFVMREGKPAGFPKQGYPKPQGEFYCGVGNSNVQYRNSAERHMYNCLDVGIDITGINAEVAIGQWEYQCFNEDTLKACDDLWLSRYILHEVNESYSLTVDMTPKPVLGDWNGSGCHTNFSNKYMREPDSKNYFKSYLDNLEERHHHHIKNYGVDNDKRLTGEHETQHINKFSYGVGDRGASVRIPVSVKENNWQGYLEDRRPASNCDPYIVARLIIESQP